MDSNDRLRRRRSLQERLGLVCCGSTWGNGSSRPSTMSINGDDDDNDLVDQAQPVPDMINMLPESSLNPECVSPSPRMNLAAALEAERSTVMRTEDDNSAFEPLTTNIESRPYLNIPTAPIIRPLSPNIEGDNRLTGNTTQATPARVSLMRLLEETDDRDEAVVDVVCCVCMGRKKGAAFIPCGHTFCRVCSRELWLNRGSCPLCNRKILEILDIF